MKTFYKAFVLSYFRWYNRISTGDIGPPHYSPCGFLSILQASNVLCILLLLSHTKSVWLLMAATCSIGAIIYWYNSNVFASIREPAKFSKLSDNVPGFREFTSVYGYLIFTVALFPAVIVTRSAA